VADVLRNRSPELIATFRALEKLVKSLGKVEVVARERYVLFRSARIFADVVIMTDAVRLAIHLPRAAEHELFQKVVADRRHVTHVAKLQRAKQVAAMKPFLREAYEFATP
jgi:predicted transport protein